MPRRSRDERGVALPSPVAALSLGAVLLAAVAYVATSGDPPPTEAARTVTTTTTPSPTPTPTPTVVAPAPKVKRPPAVRRGEIYVEVYNNSGVSGLAGATADRVSGAGWKVVGSDNWYGTIPASTVYYPARLERAAQLLAKDLGVKRLRPAISPMRLDRLTVILTTDYS